MSRTKGLLRFGFKSLSLLPNTVICQFSAGTYYHPGRGVAKRKNHNTFDNSRGKFLLCRGAPARGALLLEEEFV